MNSKFRAFLVLTAALSQVACNQPAQENTAKPVAAAISQPAKPARLTFKASVQDLIDRYNKIAADIDRSILLPPANAMEDAGRNPIFHAVRHAVTPNIYVVMEIENISGQPFSISTTAVIENQRDQMALLSTITSIGATVFGKGEQAGALVKTCAKMAKAKTTNESTRIDDIDVYCAATDGIWMAGISVSDDKSSALKTTK